MLTIEVVRRLVELGGEFAWTRSPGLALELLAFVVSYRLRSRFAQRRRSHTSPRTVADTFVAASCERWELYSHQLCTVIVLTVCGAVLLFGLESAVQDAFACAKDMPGANSVLAGRLGDVFGGTRLSLLDLQVVLWFILVAFKGRSIWMAVGVNRDMRSAGI